MKQKRHTPEEIVRLLRESETSGLSQEKCCHTTYRAASGRMAGSADTHRFEGSGSRTQFRDASGRSAGSEATSGCTSGSATATRRDASDRLTGKKHGHWEVPRRGARANTAGGSEVIGFPTLAFSCRELAFCGSPLKGPLGRTGGRGNGG